jgi:hypothetical protein
MSLFYSLRLSGRIRENRAESLTFKTPGRTGKFPTAVEAASMVLNFPIMNDMFRHMLVRSIFVLGLATPALAQVPAPFPRPGQPAAPAPRTPAVLAPQQPVSQPTPAPPAAAAATGVPTEVTLGAPIYPSAQYLESYDAGRGQRFYIFGSQTDFLQVVAFYRTMLKQRGEMIFDEPPVQMFELGRFREETMGFAPSVTVKDYTWGGSEGYLNPKRDVSPPRFKTIIQIVPVPPAALKEP